MYFRILLSYSTQNLFSTFLYDVQNPHCALPEVVTFLGSLSNDSVTLFPLTCLYFILVDVWKLV